MEMLTLIIALSTIMWYIINRFKGFWAEVKYGKYITIAVAAVFGFGLTFGLGLDLLLAIGLTQAVTVVGQILTGFTLMAGSSAVAEILEAVGGGNHRETENY